MIWGGTLGLFGLSLASLMAPLPGSGPSPEAVAVTVSAGSEFARPPPETEPVPPQVLPGPTSEAAPPQPALQATLTAPAPDTGLPEAPVAGGTLATGPVLAAPEAAQARSLSGPLIPAPVPETVGGSPGAGLAPPAPDTAPALP